MSELSRRRFLGSAGGTAAGALVLAACGGGGGGGGDDDLPQAPTTTTAPAPEEAISLLQRATAVELAAVDFYQQILDRRIAGEQATETLTLFQAHHQEHAELLQTSVKRAEGEPVEEADPGDAAPIAGRVATIASEADALRVAYDLEQFLALSYVDGAPRLRGSTAITEFMSIGGIEARHMSVLGPALNLPTFSPGAFLGEGDTPL